MGEKEVVWSYAESLLTYTEDRDEWDFFSVINVLVFLRKTQIYQNET